MEYFLMKAISNVVDSKHIKPPVIRDGRIISLKIGFEPVNKYLILYLINKYS